MNFMTVSLEELDYVSRLSGSIKPALGKVMHIRRIWNINIDDYFEFSEYIRIISGISIEISGYTEAQEIFEETRSIPKSKIKGM